MRTPVARGAQRSPACIPSAMCKIELQEETMRNRGVARTSILFLLGLLAPSEKEVEARFATGPRG